MDQNRRTSKNLLAGLPQDLIAYLHQRMYLHAYVLRGIAYGMEDFSLSWDWDSLGQLRGFTAFWEDEGTATIGGDRSYIEKRVQDLAANYTLYDLPASAISEELKEKILEAEDFMISESLVMVRRKGARHTESPVYQKLSEQEWQEVSERFQTLYQKKLVPLEARTMTGMGLVESGEVIATVCVEPVSDGLAVLSNLFVVPESRGRGHARRLLESVIAYEEPIEWMLFVYSDNEKAISLYKSLGFEELCKTVNIERRP